MRMRDIQMYLEKFTDGNKGTAISDCQVYIEMQDGSLQEIKKMELQESRMLGKINSSAAWRVVMKGEPRSQTNQSLTFKVQNPTGGAGEPSGEPAFEIMKYKFTVAEDGKAEEEKESMSFKKLFKSLININPKWTGSLTYDNKKGRQVIHRIKNGRRMYG